MRDSRRRRASRVALPFIGIAVLLVLVLRLHAGTSSTGTLPRPATGSGTEGQSPRQVVPSAAALSTGITPRACLIFAPLHGNLHHVVFIDPGHGGRDPGASGVTSSGATIYEKDVTLAVGLDVSTLLRDEGYTVVLSRDTDSLVTRTLPGDLNGKLLTAAGEHRDLVARVACANAAHAQALVAIHFDAYGDPSVNGAETLYDNARPFRAANRRLATLAQADVVARLRAAGWAVPDRGVIDDLTAGTPALTTEGTVYGHLLELGPAASGWLKFPSAMPGILAEPLFLTHPAEADVAASTQGQRVMADGLARAISAFFAPPAKGAA
ncbi:MAG TPA: N-acetylmuramoyl-L-alanine amidase [Chloroflexota bacterium]